MGGKAFRSEGILTPRMPPTFYYKVLDQVRSKLTPLYVQVESPIEAPEKVDHGDIDVFVVPATNIPPSRDEVATVLDAISSKESKPIIHLAMPWPANTAYPITAREESTVDRTVGAMNMMSVEDSKSTTKSEPDAKAQPLYVQVDLNVCKNVDELKYHLFMHNHGDFMNILGGIIRRCGLTCSNSGFYIRIVELESFNKNLARYKIFEKPEEILRYLGMDERRFWRPFDSWEECMDYAATCRFHDPAKGKKYDEVKTEIMNSEDRKRLSKRSMFRYWIEIYLPSHRDAPAGPSSTMSRDDVIEEAKQLLGKDFAESFDCRRADGIREMEEQHLWAYIRKASKAEGSQLTYAMKGLKREITIHPEDKTLMSDVQKDYASGRWEEVRAWSLENWSGAGTRQEQLDRERSTNKFLTKLEREGKLQPRVDSTE